MTKTMRYTEGKIEGCLQNEPPFCQVACPFHLDVIDLISKVQRSAWKAAYRSYASGVGFPSLVATLCPQACQRNCPRSEKDDAIAIANLEQAVINLVGRVDPTAYNMPPKGKDIAIIGGGPSGLAATLRLAQKGYAVTLYEKNDRIGGHLHQLLPASQIQAEIDHQFKFETFTLKLNTEIRDLGALSADAIYLATGQNGQDFGIIPNPDGAFASTKAGIFMGGSLCGQSSMEAIADGLSVCTAIERYLKTGSMNQPRIPWQTRLKVQINHLPTFPRIETAKAIYTAQEARDEAARCLKCTCDACYRACDLMNYFRKLPKRIAEEIEITVHPGTLDGNGTVATRLISTCNQCGLCKTVCPVGIDTGELFLHSHRAMREKGAMPWAFHDFFLRDMAFANHEAGLFRLPDDHHLCEQLFFPGCQLGASDPRYVRESYRFLLEHWPDTGLFLGCCGAPAEWAGDESLRESVLTNLRDTWERTGRPRLILACPSCHLILSRHLPQMELVFLYELMRQKGLRGNPGQKIKTISVFDPCAARDQADLHQTIRTLTREMAINAVPLPMEMEQAQCCSWGGQVSIAHPPYARHMIRQRIQSGEAPFVTYCSNCRDLFAGNGKPVTHILDLLLNLSGFDRPPPLQSQRRQNRITLKKTLLNEYWQEETTMPQMPINLMISPALKKKLSDEMILDEEVRQVVANCEASGEKVLNSADGTVHGYSQVGHITIWVSYRPRPEGAYELFNAYAHRMQIVR